VRQHVRARTDLNPHREHLLIAEGPAAKSSRTDTG